MKNSDWINHPQRLTSIIKAISKCSLSSSLILLNINGYPYEDSEAEELMKELDLIHIKVFTNK